MQLLFWLIRINFRSLPPKQPKDNQSMMNKPAAPVDNKIGAVPNQASKPAASAEPDKDKGKDPGAQSAEDGKDKVRSMEC